MRRALLMTGFDIKRNAEAFGVTITAAIRMRIRYLLQQIHLWPDYLECIHNEPPDVALCDAAGEILKLQAYAAALKQPVNPDAITDEQISRAREYPITEMIEFSRGKVACPFHDDKNPSAFHGNRTNRLVCPVCNDTWSALDILILRDGNTFSDAVKQLAGGY